MLNQCSLVLKSVALAEMIEFVVKVLINFAASTILYEEAAEDTEPPHPYNLSVPVVSV